MTPAAQRPYRRTTRTSRIRLAIGLGIGVGALYAVVSSAGGFDDSFSVLQGAQPSWLAAGALAEASSYLALGLLLRRLVGARIDRRTAIGLGLVVSGLGNVLPAAPAEGLTMAGAELRRRDVAPQRTWIALGLLQWIWVRTLFAVAALDALVVVTAASRRYPKHAPGRFTVGAVAVLILALLAATAWLASRRGTMEVAAVVVNRLKFWRDSGTSTDGRAQGARWYAEMHEVLGSPGAHAAIGALALASCLADAACFQCALLAVGISLKPALFLLAYAIGMITALVPLLPNGLGLVETVVPALLHYRGVPLATALAGVLVFRALGTLLPALIGTIALIRLRLAHPAAFTETRRRKRAPHLPLTDSGHAPD
jgi:uncharacterized protein (TIRG00374 family)